MMRGIEARAKAVGAARVRRVVDRLAARLGEEPGVRVEAGADRVTITGRGVLKRLRWIGGLLR